jgi:small-conductance mechanosensitive channel
MASDRITPEYKQRNPITYETHKRQTFWQIYFPLIVFGVLVVVAIVLALLADDHSNSKWADISLIYMIAISLVTAAIVIVGLLFLAYYTTQLLKSTPYFFFTLQRYTYLIEFRVRKYSNSAAEPFIRANSFFAGVGRLGGRRNKPASAANEDLGTESNNKENTQ